VRVRFRSSFVRDLKKIRDPTILAAVKHAIGQIEQATSLSDIDQLRKLSGASGYYRIRIGDYRLGLADCDGGLECVRCLHRRDIYRRFP
jgi:mRNA interferase RelE/StbE